MLVALGASIAAVVIELIYFPSPVVSSSFAGGAYWSAVAWVKTTAIVIGLLAVFLLFLAKDMKLALLNLATIFVATCLLGYFS
ncbi:MAG: hypothetical protein AAGB29_11835 [Planctomycetota bacterium]